MYEQDLAATPKDSRERFEARRLLPGMAKRIREVGTTVNRIPFLHVLLLLFALYVWHIGGLLSTGQAPTCSCVGIPERHASRTGWAGSACSGSSYKGYRQGNSGF